MGTGRHLAFLLLFFCFGFLPGCSSKEDVTVPADITAAIEAEDSHEDKVRLQQEIIRRQKMEMKRQDRELEDLKRQQFYNESYRRYEKKKIE